MITRSGTEAFGILKATPAWTATVIAPRTPRAPERRYDVDEPLTAPRDELKVRFSRGDESTATKNTFVEPSAAAAQRAAVAQQQQGRMSNEELLEEIRGLMPADPAEAEEPPEATPVDLNGIKPRDLLIGAASYGVFSYLAWQFTNVAATYFADHPAQATDFYVVSRLTSFARVVVVGVAALGAGVTAIAGAGQAALAVKVAQGIAAGELDPTAERRITTERALQHAWITGDALTLSPQAGEELSTEEPGKEGVSSVRSALSRFNARRAMEKVKSGARRLSIQ